MHIVFHLVPDNIREYCWLHPRTRGVMRRIERAAKREFPEAQLTWRFIEDPECGTCVLVALEIERSSFLKDCTEQFECDTQAIQRVTEAGGRYSHLVMLDYPTEVEADDDD